MKRVVLLGDSIRLSYEAEVRAHLADAAFVWGPAENGQHSVNLLLNAWGWIVAQQPDVLHLNAGLWDTRRIIRDQPETIVPVDVYRRNVRQLLTLAKQHTRARVIWATTTPSIEAQTMAQHRRMGLAGRVASDIPIYNAAACEEARMLDVTVNDLYTTVVDAGPERLLTADGTHFNEIGVGILAKQVAKAIRTRL